MALDMSMGEQPRISKSTRRYRLQARAAGMDRTRERITRAAVELHGTIGPAATTMSAVAERAGVTRATLYRYFANEEILFEACSADWRAANPAPDLARWTTIADPVDRVGTALVELYAWYRSTEAMRANLLRDLDTLPAPIATRIAAFPGAMRDVLEVGWPQERSALRHAAIGLALSFETWRALAREGIDDREAASLMVAFVVGAGT
jgi:AcrR family transcriptional regulator